MDSISLTIPLREKELRAAADMLNKLASGEGTSASVTEETNIKATEEINGWTERVIGEPKPETETPNTTNDTGFVVPELDSEGLPWDERIGSSSKAILAKTGAWKLKRGVNPKLVEQVKAELRDRVEVWKVQGLTPVEESSTAVEPAPPPEAGASSIFAQDTVSSEPDSGAAGSEITTFAELVTAITANKIDKASITEVLNSLGVHSLPVLGTKPELVPQVALLLGL